MQSDPLDDFVPESEHVCEHGWVQVKDAYARHMAAQKVAEDSEQFAAAYASYLNSYYPCRVCRPVQFFRWAGKHYDREHDVSSCAECIEAHTGNRRRATKATAMASGNVPSAAPRRDIDG